MSLWLERLTTCNQLMGHFTVDLAVPNLLFLGNVWRLELQSDKVFYAL